MNMRNLWILLWVCVYHSAFLMAQGTGAMWITKVNNQTSVIEGYRHNVDSVGTSISLQGTYTVSPFSTMTIKVNGNSITPSTWSASSGTFNATFPVLSACSKMVVEVGENVPQSAQWTEPIEVFVYSASQSNCLPDCIDCRSGEVRTNGMQVDLVRGTLEASFQDLDVIGPGALRFDRFYDNVTNIHGDLSYGWRHTYSHSLDLSDLSQVRYKDNMGHLIIYGKNRNTGASGYGQYDEDWFFQTILSRLVDGTYEVKYRDKAAYRFDSAGKLIAITDRRNNTIIIAYDSNNPPRISTVTDPFGRTLSFSYNGTDKKIRTVTTNPGNYTLNFTYAGNNLVAFTDPRGRIWTYEYQTSGDTHNLTGIKDPLNHCNLTATYNGNDKVTFFSAEGGVQSRSLNYNTSSTIVTDSLGRATTYSFDTTLKAITQISGPGCGCGGGQVRNFVYDNSLRRTSETDGLGNETRYEWLDRSINGNVFPTLNLRFKREGYGSPVQRNTEFANYYPVGDSRDDLYQSEFSESVDTPGNQRELRYAYDLTGNLTSFERRGYSNHVFLAFAEATTYNSRGLVLTANGPRTDVTDVTAYEYYADNDSTLANRGRLKKITDALNHATQYDNYNFYGRAGKETDANGVITIFSFDAWGREVGRTVKADANYPFDLVTQSVYQQDDLLDYVIYPEGNVQDYVYDNAHRRTETQQKLDTGSLGDRVVFQYDTESNRTRRDFQKREGGQWTTKYYTQTAYDSYNRLWKIINTNGTYKERLYDADGNLQYFDDSDSAHGGPTHQYTYSHDALNRNTSVTVLNEGVNQVVSYGYNSDNKLTLMSGDIPTMTEYYDDFGRPIRLVSPDSGTTNRAFDPAGNLTSETDARGVIVQKTYDALDRLLTTSYPDSSLNVTLAYDTAAYGIGRLATMTDQSGTTTYLAYNRNGILLHTLKSINSVNYVTTYTFNKDDTLAGITYPSGRVVTYTIDAATQRPTAIAAVVNGVSQNVVTGIAFYPFGPVSTASFSNGLVLSRTHDTDNILTSNVVSGSVLSLGYTHNNEGYFTGITDNLNSANSQTITYDDRDQILADVGPWGSESYLYDAAGNRLTRTLNGAVTTYNYATGTNRLASLTGAESASFSYDPDGNITSYINSYTYNDAGRLASVNSGSIATYAYDGNYSRAKKITGGSSTLFFYGPGGSLLTQAGPTFVRDYVYLEDEVVAVVAANFGDTLNFYHNDHLGRPVAVTNLLGAVTWTGQFYAFGTLFSQTGSGAPQMRFPGQYYDSETALNYNWHRYYAEKIGQYLSPDPLSHPNAYPPIVLRDVSIQNPAEDSVTEAPTVVSSLLDRHSVCMSASPVARSGQPSLKQVYIYAYASNNALGAIDPTGLGPEPPWMDMCETCCDIGCSICDTMCFGHGGCQAVCTCECFPLGNGRHVRCRPRCACYGRCLYV